MLFLAANGVLGCVCVTTQNGVELASFKVIYCPHTGSTLSAQSTVMKSVMQALPA